MSSITSIGSTTSAQFDALAQLLQQASASRKQTLFDTLGNSSSTSSTSDSVSLSSSSSASQMSNYLDQLNQLRTSDPTKYKEVTAELADKFKKAAESESDPGKKQFLTDMASAFEKASTDGSQFEMPKPPGGGQGPHGAPPPPPPDSDSDSDSNSLLYSLSSLFNTSSSSDSSSDSTSSSSSSSSASGLLSLLASHKQSNDTTALSIFEAVLGK